MRSMTTARSNPPRGMTLLEILLSIAIFLGAMTAIGQLVSLGSRAATRSQLMNEAILRCESKMNEMLSGASPMQATSLTAFDDDPSWSWQAQVDAGPTSKLIRVEQRVEHFNAQGQANLSFSLVRLVRDPGEIQAEAEAAQQATTSSSSTGSSTSSSSSSKTSGSSGSSRGSSR